MPAQPRTLRSASHWGAFRMEVEGGRLVGVAPFEHDPDPTDLIHVWPEMLHSPLRVARPAIRRGWLDGDRGAKRGDDLFVEVPWDEALDRVAGELSRVRAAHGNQAIFGGSYGWSSAGRFHHARTLLHRFLHGIGGCVGQVTNYSYGAAMTFLPRIVGTKDAVGAALTSWQSVVEHADVLLAFGGLPGKNWEVQSGGFGLHQHPRSMRALAGSRVRVVNVSPHRADMPAEVPAEWLPLRPNTDTALMLALIHAICAAGREDRAFLDGYTHGFDRFRRYVMGESDGVPKTPEWAAAITGVPAERIAALAADLPGRRVMVTATWSLQRARHGEQPYWAAVALAAVLGQVGLPGGGFAFGYGSSNGQGSPRYGTPLPGLPTGANPVGISIPVARVADLLLQPGASIRYDGRDLTYPDIRLVYWAGGNPFHHHQDLNRLREAFRRPDTVIVHEPYWTATARHADIVLPATTTLERNDIGGSSRDPYLLAMHQAVAPVGEARNDYDIFADLAGRLGDRDRFTEGRDEAGWLRVIWAEITDRLAARGINPPAFDEFWEQGTLRLPPPRDPYVMFADYRKGAAQLATPSGRIELFSEWVAGLGDPEQPGHPVWREPEEWLGAADAERFPLHLLTPQPARRLHSQMDGSRVSFANKRDGREVLRLAHADAVARGIRDGDPVRVFNGRGSCLAVAEPTDDVMPGVALLPTGAAFDPDGAGGDRNSNPNVLTLDRGTSELGQGCSAQSCLVEVEKLAGPLPELAAYRAPAMASGSP